MSPVEVLKQYWGFDSFRGKQEEIINHVLSKKDTLAILPTGGGKSICFQVPALAQEGICIVISPLIALMKDQVARLKQLNIKAEAIFSGITHREIDIILDNCIYGETKFLYVSPERLLTELFVERFKKMNVSLIAVDEAHCISMWGYDFRPAYLEIASLREMKPELPIIALTASATPQVKKDISEKLQLKNPVKFEQSFLRTNLKLKVFERENKTHYLLQALSSQKGSGLIYVRSRKATKTIVQLLWKKGISAEFYHAGLSTEERNRKQKAWLNNETQYMVCTNAFGMGIDKPDVRLVVHIDIPENLESYYQEAGRAGRDGRESSAILIYDEADVLNADKNLETKFPDLETINAVYQALSNSFSLAIGTGAGLSFDIDIQSFATNFRFSIVEVYNVLKVLVQQSLLEFNDNPQLSSRFMFTADNNTIYALDIARKDLSPLIKLLLRGYSGITDRPVQISEKLIAQRLKVELNWVYKQLRFFVDSGMGMYAEATSSPKITFIENRPGSILSLFDRDAYMQRLSITKSQLDAMKSYLYSDQCRFAVMRNYFGEESVENCGNCDVCRKVKGINAQEINQKLLEILGASEIGFREIMSHFELEEEEVVIEELRALLDSNYLAKTSTGKLIKK